jgi:hypothetical protein
MRTARLTVLMPPERKAEIERKASTMGISTGELVRRAVDEYDHLTPEQEAELALLVEEANKAIPEMAKSLDRMIDSLRETREDIQRTLGSLSRRA